MRFAAPARHPRSTCRGATDRGAAALGASRARASGRTGMWYGVAALLRVAGDARATGCTSACCSRKYRAYRPVPRLRRRAAEARALLWRLGRGAGSDHPRRRCCCRSTAAASSSQRLAAARAAGRGHGPAARARSARASRYLVDVGLGYLTLDRQSRTLSGGEVQRINLTTALGTSLVNTLFVLDEPSIGLHPRDIGRLIGVLHRLRDAGNTLVVVEHDPDVIRAADRVLDMGPGPGRARRRGRVLRHAAASCSRAARSLTAQYLRGPQARVRRPAPPAAAAPPPAGRARIERPRARPSTTSRASTCASRSTAWCASPA